MKLFSKKISPYTFWVVLLILIRAFLNYAIPLMDKTEARYSEIARIMAETNNWTTLQIDYGVPFWAKPPLSTWLSAISFNIFGVNEFAVRFPYLLLNILVILLVGKYAKRKGLDFLLPALILLTIPEFLLHTGVVSTDTALAFCVTLVMISFWEGIHNKEQTFWKYLFFAGLGLGLLAKGPIIIILTAPPVFVWMVLFKQYKTVWKKLPWIVGIIITAIIAIPWYYLAEQKTPGFIDYFIVGEHFKRFLSSGWKGDKYGFPKSQPLGMIWVFLFVFAIPWIQILISKLWKNKSILFKNKWVSFLLFWLLWTPLFFTVSKSLIHPYIMPIMVPIALLITYWWEDLKYPKRIIDIGLVFPILALVVYIAISFTSKKDFYINSDKYFIEQHINDNLPIFHWETKSYSGQFYSKGKLKAMENAQALTEQLSLKKPFLLIIPHKKIKNIDENTMSQLKELASNYKKSIYIFN
ncbi:dolichyl-phosphate-mannose-protein mannosyltransferase [Lutibacter oceani]|uniref:Dolichyl-phosphate-mannose-protein mannosyltransferase n=1 Tax=Lutibacter oceani TaxID=1853311 RepID=A0A3D9RJ69_9FLAO|nr:phospholipid carrier-dependent glycosyltransferase [Lutibacter oceani]REE79933.1 dolichyl-phosphate-mannose-protein mannosyltransferase [Lutibacter oceani]